ncbi:hypothetical protein RSOLAG1IB_03550 [Rhizoctonia solani AG-1 IB]|uniref:Uncharacterized protein n=1 Tax=Thanatephorus cucumeris (strain AG1-IB / isolate 7/3/14) TaxID=1108050 RepID=A0A0B7FTX1_THACB|nr:hypothetical protein RSOLAG1IB_03550 [Rhizoctonia solani AG-1 IB]
MSEDVPSREPKRVPSRDTGTMAPPVLAVVITVFSLSVLFLIYRRASSWRSVVQHRLRTLSVRQGAIRLPDDEAGDHVPVIPSHHTDAQARVTPTES